MARVRSRTRLLIVAGALVASSAIGSPSAAQSTGMVKGKVVDTQGAPVEAAKVLIEYQIGRAHV